MFSKQYTFWKPLFIIMISLLSVLMLNSLTAFISPTTVVDEVALNKMTVNDDDYRYVNNYRYDEDAPYKAKAFLELSLHGSSEYSMEMAKDHLRHNSVPYLVGSLFAIGLIATGFIFKNNWYRLFLTIAWAFIILAMLGGSDW